MRGLIEGAWCPWPVGLLDVLLIPGECSGGTCLGSLLRPPVQGKAGALRAGCGFRGSRPGGRGREEKDACAAASPPVSGGRPRFLLREPEPQRPPAAPRPLAAGERVSSGAPRGPRARGGAGPELPAAGVRGRGLSADRSEFESPLGPTAGLAACLPDLALSQSRKWGY